ncbi:MAG: hypothetical protein V7785_19940, partial [Bermanella sp.]
TSHFQQVNWQISYGVMLCFIPMYIYYQYGSEGISFSISLVAGFFVLNLIPHCLIHYNYYSRGKGKCLCIDLKSKTFQFLDGGFRVEFKLADIDSVVTTISKSKANRNLRLFPWDSYCYSNILLKSGDEILITNLIIRELKWPIKLPNEKFIEAYYCWI